MKHKFTTILLLSLACLSEASTNINEAKIINYGTYRVLGKEEIVRTPETTSGLTRISAGTILLTSQTNRIPAQIGVRFGMWYEVGNLSGKDVTEVEFLKIAKHPPITKPDGTISRGFTFVEKQMVKSGRVIGWTGYGLDHDYELVVGDWEFEMQYQGKTLCKQKFTVFK